MRLERSRRADEGRRHDHPLHAQWRERRQSVNRSGCCRPSMSKIRSSAADRERVAESRPVGVVVVLLAGVGPRPVVRPARRIQIGDSRDSIGTRDRRYASIAFDVVGGPPRARMTPRSHLDDENRITAAAARHHIGRQMHVAQPTGQPGAAPSPAAHSASRPALTDSGAIAATKYRGLNEIAAVITTTAWPVTVAPRTSENVVATGRAGPGSRRPPTSSAAICPFRCRTAIAK